MRRRTTITLTPEITQWAREKGSRENISVSKLMSRLLVQEKASDCRRAYEEWKRLPRDLGGAIDAVQRFTRDEAHERR